MVGISSLAVLLLAATTSVSAQSSATLWLPLVEDPTTVIGSILGSDATATTYTFACAATVDPDYCDVPTPCTWTAGPSTIAWTTSYDTNDYYGTEYSMDTDTATWETDILTCKITASATGVCVESQLGPSLAAASTTTVGQDELGLVEVTLTSNLAAVTQIEASFTSEPSQITETVVSTKTVVSASSGGSASTGVSKTGSASTSTTTTGTGSASGTTTVTQVVTPSSSKTANAAAGVTRGPWVGAGAAVLGVGAVMAAL